MPDSGCRWKRSAGCSSAGYSVGIRSTIDDWRAGARWTWNYASDPLPWFALVCIVGAILTRILRARPGQSRQLGLAGTERLVADCITIDCWPSFRKDVSQSARSRPAVAYLLPGPGRRRHHRVVSLTWHGWSIVGIRELWAVLDMALIRQDNISAGDLERSARRLDGRS